MQSQGNKNGTKGGEAGKENIKWCITRLTTAWQDNAASSSVLLDSFQRELMDPPCLGGKERKETYLMTPSCLPFSGWSQLAHRMLTLLHFWVYYLTYSGGTSCLTSWCGATPRLQSGGRDRDFMSLLTSSLDTRIAGLLHGRHTGTLLKPGCPFWEAEITKVLEQEESQHHGSWHFLLTK